MYAALLSVLSPSPEPTSGGTSVPDFTNLVPLVTGAGGALVVLLLFAFLFLTDRIVTTKSVTTLREADNNRFNDMVAQRDSLVKALEQANATSASASANAQASLDLLRDALPPKRGGGSR